MKPLDIALCITDLNVGGAERCMVELACRLDRREFRPVVYCLAKRPATGDDSLIRMLKLAEVEFHCLGARGNRHVFRVVRRLQQLLASQNPQVVQSFLFHANIVARIAARLASVPKVVSGIRVAEPRRRHLLIDRLTDRLVGWHVCVSRSVARFSETRAKLPAEKLVVIPNGVDLARFPAEHPADLGQFGVGADRRVVTFVGRLDRQKGLPWLIETAPAWLKRLPGCDLLLVGKGTEGPKLKRMCCLLGIVDRVHFAGQRPDVPEILAASELLVLPSAWEGMPNVVLEAMATRLPVVATAVEGVCELLGPAAERQTVGYGDSRALTDKIVALIEDRRTATRLGAENRRRAEENFDIIRMVATYQDLWESILTA